MAAGAAGKRKWIYPALCFVITFLGGTLYSYSIVGYEIQKLWGVSAAEAGIPYLAALGVYGYLMVLGGVLERRFGSEKVPLYLGALMFGLGFTSSSFVERNVALFTASYLVAGLGLALMDSMTLPIATSWVPERPGLAVGVARTGFGIAPPRRSAASRAPLQGVRVQRGVEDSGRILPGSISGRGLSS